MRKIILFIGIILITLGVLNTGLLISEMYHINIDPERVVSLGHFIWLCYFIFLTLVGILSLAIWNKKLEAKHGGKIVVLTLIIIIITPVIFILGFIPG